MACRRHCTSSAGRRGRPKGKRIQCLKAGMPYSFHISLLQNCSHALASRIPGSERRRFTASTSLTFTLMLCGIPSSAAPRFPTRILFRLENFCRLFDAQRDMLRSRQSGDSRLFFSLSRKHNSRDMKSYTPCSRPRSAVRQTRLPRSRYDAAKRYRRMPEKKEKSAV
nr:hypothetical protein CFP56_21604 [Quercus suber]